ncbi:MAG: SLATT domain-containing protein [Cyclobacteriaceae bacterium]
MSTENMTAACLDIIGETEPDDYILDIEEHRKRYKEVPELVDLLSPESIKLGVSEYHHWDKKALEAQATFKKWQKRGLWLTFLAAAFGIMLASYSGISALLDLSDAYSNYAVGFLMVLTVSTAGLGSVAVSQIGGSGFLGEWMQNRSRAENERLAYFRDLGGLALAKGEQKTCLLMFYYFVRYQLDIQLNYYTTKSDFHKLKGRKLNIAASVALGVVAIINGISGALGITDLAWTSIAGFALIANAYASMLTNQESVNQHNRNAARYQSTRDILFKLKKESDAVVSGIKEGDLDLLTTFIDAVQEPISAENRQWVANFEDRNTAIGKLRESLQKHLDK